MLSSVAHHAGEVRGHGLDGIHHLGIIASHQISDCRSGTRSGNHHAAKGGKVPHVVMDVGCHQIAQCQSADELLARTAELLGSHDNRQVNRNALVAAPGVGHHRLLAAVHAGIGSCRGTNQRTVQKIIGKHAPFDVLRQSAPDLQTILAPHALGGNRIVHLSPLEQEIDFCHVYVMDKLPNAGKA